MVCTRSCFTAFSRAFAVAPCNSSRSSRLVINWTSFGATIEASRWSTQNTRISVPDGINRRDNQPIQYPRPDLGVWPCILEPLFVGQWVFSIQVRSERPEPDFKNLLRFHTPTAGPDSQRHKNASSRNANHSKHEISVSPDHSSRNNTQPGKSAEPAIQGRNLWAHHRRTAFDRYGAARLRFP